MVLIGIHAAIRDAEHLVLQWRFDFVFLFVCLFCFFFKGCEDNLPLAFGFLTVGCFGNIFLQYLPQGIS